jgi:recombination protein RecT
MARTTEKLQAAVATREQGVATTAAATIYDLIESNKRQLARALPANLDADRFARLVWTEVRKTPRLLDCSGASLLGAAMFAAQLGLEPGPLGHVWLTPRRVKGVWTVVPIIGYRGYIELAYRSGAVVDFDAQVVHAHDTFKQSLGLHRDLVHEVPPLGEERGDAVGYYAVAYLKSGSAHFKVMGKGEIEARRKRSGASDDGPWASDYDAMALKTVVRAMAPLLPLSAETQRAIATDEQARTEVGPDMLELPSEVIEEPSLEVVENEGAIEVVEGTSEAKAGSESA